MEQQLSIVPITPLPPDPLTDPYRSAMTPHFSRLHQHLFPPFFRAIHVDGYSLAQLRQLASEATLIFVTPQIGQCEYHYFNWLFAEEQLPLAHYGHGRTIPSWLPVRQQLRLWITMLRDTFRDNAPPHPIRSGHVAALIHAGQSVLLRLKTSPLYDDRFWDNPEEDPLRAIIAASRTATRPCYVIPLQFLWDKRPERSAKSVIDLLFGSSHQPSRLRKFFLFWRGYKTRVLSHIGEPIPIHDLLSLHPDATDPMLTDSLRDRLLGVFQRERKGTTGPMLKPRRWMIEQAVQDSSVQKMLYDIAHEKQSDVEALQLLAHKYANEIAADVNYEVLEIMYRVVKWILRTIYNGIVVDDASIATIRQAITEGPIALVPNHRSHMDYLLLSTLLYEHNVALPYVAGGINLSFWPFGWIARKCGTFFLRRTFRGNPLYRAVFAAYLKLLVREGHCIEFFIEGGRSRTGKALKPRMGIISMLGQAMQDGAARELRFIPVSITYDQVPEQGAYLSEIAGGQKKQESFWEMLRLGKHLRRRYGRIYVNVGTPVAYSTAIEGALERPLHATAVQTEDRQRVTQYLATTLMREISRSIVVTPSALAATALLMYEKPAVTEAEIQQAGLHLHQYLTWKKVHCSQLVHDAPIQALREAAQFFVASRVIQRHVTFEPHFYAVDRHHRVILDLNRNTIAHYMISLSCVSALLLQQSQRHSSVPTHVLETEFRHCQDLLQNEFVFATRSTVQEHIDRVLEYFVGLQAIDWTPGSTSIDVKASHETLSFFSELLRHYFEAYWLVFHTARKLAFAGLEEKRLLQQIRGYGEHLLLLGVLRRSEALSQITFRNALQTFTALGVLRNSIEGTPGKNIIFFDQNPRADLLQQQLEGLALKPLSILETDHLSTKW